MIKHAPSGFEPVISTLPLDHHTLRFCEEEMIDVSKRITRIQRWLSCDMRWWHVIWGGDMWYEVVTCDMRWWHVIWGGDMWYEVVTCDMRWWHVIWGGDMWYEVVTCDMRWWRVIWDSEYLMIWSSDIPVLDPWFLVVCCGLYLSPSPRYQDE